MWYLSQIGYPAKSVWLLMSVVTVLLPLTHGQAYHFIIGHRQRNYDPLYRETETNSTTTSTADLDNNNSTIIVTAVRESNDLSQAAMDIITIVWYVATFLALAAFFLLMACSDRRCSDTQNSANTNANEAPIPPPSPSPSYSEFAPPSYESVMKMNRACKTGIFVVPRSTEQSSSKDDSNSANNNLSSATETSINFYTINELQKLPS